ncbi:MAG: response regulator [Desulfarculaceae bacterium]|nr:response regulator [Desulfarculaceae bacterium]MCF8124475.1 response regulator [Desulfarculaceae bacterium]
MKDQKILVVDDEKNIRLSLSQALAPLGWPVETAVNGEEALGKLDDQSILLIILDLRMPGMDGIEVLRRVSELRPDIRVIIVTAYGTVERAVEAMKLGAVDLIQKPFSPEQIRDLTQQVLARDQLNEDKAADYQTHLELAKKAVGERNFKGALSHAQKAIALDPYRAEAFNLVGCLHEVLHQREDAIKNYRMAYEADPSYAPARENLDRLTSHGGRGPISWESAGKQRKDDK